MFIPSALSMPALFGNTLDPDTQAIASRMTTAPSGDRLLLMNDLITGLKASGVWDKLDALWVTAAADSQAAGLNWISSSYTLTPVNSPAFTVDRGYAGDGSTSYLNTGLSPLAAAKAVLNSSSVGVYINNDPGASSSKIEIGAASTGQTLIGANDNGTSFRFRVNTGTTAFASGLTGGLGLTSVSRTASNVTTPYRDGVAKNASNAASTAQPEVPLFIGAANASGSAALFSDRRIAASFIGQSLSDTEMASLYSSLQTYLTNIGASA